MALSASSLFAAFDVTDGAQERDISPVLEDAIFYDLNFMGDVQPAFGSPVFDVVFRWNEEALNADTDTTTASATSSATSLSVTDGTLWHVGDYGQDTSSGSTEIVQVTAISSNTLTVTRGINSTTQASIASGATLSIMRLEQEGSDIGSDSTLNPTVRTNWTSIIPGRDLQISGSQLARRMATNEYADFLARQLAARATEWKINATRHFVYSEDINDDGSDSAYRAMAGMRSQIRDNSGVTDSTSEPLAYSVLNEHNKSVVDKGVFPDRLLIGTDLVGSVSGIDSSVRRLRESDSQVGYVVQEVLLNQGNMVKVVVDPRVNAGDALLYTNEKVTPKPLNGRAFFVIAATDFVDGKKRRVLGEWTLEFRHPQAAAYLSAKT